MVNCLASLLLGFLSKDTAPFASCVGKCIRVLSKVCLFPLCLPSLAPFLCISRIFFCGGLRRVFKRGMRDRLSLTRLHCNGNMFGWLVRMIGWLTDDWLTRIIVGFS